MAKHNELGKKGEKIAVNYLLANRYEILEENYRFSRAEVDIIAKKEEVLIFVEVKTRSNVSWGTPEQFVSPKKIELIMDAAYHYMEKVNHDWEIRFDIIAITFSKTNEMKLEHFKDAFVP